MTPLEFHFVVLYLPGWTRPLIYREGQLRARGAAVAAKLEIA